MSTSDDETVPVRVKDLETVAVILDAYGSDEALEIVNSYLHPKPRLVTVDLDELKAIVNDLPGQERWAVMSEFIERLEKDA